MPPLQDDGLKEREGELEHPESVTPMLPGEQAYFDQIQAGLDDISGEGEDSASRELGSLNSSWDATPNFAPNFKPSMNEQSVSSNPQAEGNSDSSGGDISYRSQSLAAGFAGAGVTGGTLLAMKVAGLFAKRNKGKLMGGGVAAIVIILVGIFSGSLAFINAKENAQDRLGSATDASMQTMSDKMLESLSWLTTTEFKRRVRLNQNALQFTRILDSRGFSFTDEGLRTPEGDFLTRESDIKQRLNVEWRDTGWGNRVSNSWRRGPIMKRLIKRLSISQANPVSRDNPVGKDEDGKRNRFTKRLRSMTIGGAEDAGEEVKNAKNRVREAVGASAAEEALKEAEELVENPEATPRNNVSRMVRNTGSAGSEALQSSVNNLASSGVLSRASSIVEISSLLCQAGKLAVGFYAGYYVVQKFNLIRVASALISVGDGHKLGVGVDTDQLDEAALIFANSSGARNAYESAGMQWLSGNSSVSLDERFHDALSVDKNEAKGFLGAMVTAFSVGAVVTTCNLLTNQTTQIGLATADIAIQVGAAFFSGGGSTVATQGGREVIERGVANRVAREIGVSAGTAIATEVAGSFGQELLFSRLTEALSGTINDIAAKGTEQIEEGYNEAAGNMFASGAGALFEASGRSVGMNSLTPEAYVDLQRIAHKHKQERLAQTSLFDRFLGMGVHNTRSLTAQALINSPIAQPTPTAIAKGSALALMDLSALGKQAQRFTSVAFSGSAYAQDGGIRLNDRGHVVDLFGNEVVGNNFNGIDLPATLQELYDTGEIDNEGEPTESSNLKSYIENCEKLDRTKEGNTTELQDECKESAQTKKYDAYKAFSGSAEGWDVSMNPNYYVHDEGAGNVSGDSGSVNPSEDTTDIPCPAGTEDGDVHQDYGPGKSPGARIRICGIPGAIPASSGVNSSVAANVLRMIEDAKAQGITLTGSAFRSFDQQVELRQINKCPDLYTAPSGSCKTPTAKPGNSMHEVGLAIDFSSYDFSWLANNAARYGFKNLPLERWHWSVNGN